MDHDDPRPTDDPGMAALAAKLFLKLEVLAYIVLGLLLCATVLLGISSAGFALIEALRSHGEAEAIITTVDRLLFVLMVVEILHTVRVSFRSGTLVCEPFLVVGLIASIRRILVITLESSQVNLPGKWNSDSQAVFNATMLELVVLGILIVVMVASIYVLRRSVRRA
jgi:uncharacterized membrane protein (DUF373 family)